MVSATATAAAEPDAALPLTLPAATGEGYNEALAPDGGLRRHWRALAEFLKDLGSDGLAERWAAAQRIIRENGISYATSDATGHERPWNLDAIPLMIGSEDWAQLSAGIAQRARLINRLLQDLYGPQEMLRAGAVPAAAVFGQDRYLRPAHGVPVPEGVYLHLYAADLVRGPDGRWRVVADRTQSPTGKGYALENRVVTARALAEPFRNGNVQRLAAFFAGFKAATARLAPRPSDDARIILLSPGPQSPVHFEHAYLARYLGLTLVEGADLTVRGDIVYLKTMAGLKRVDAIRRRLDDLDCDPLELSSTSALGVPGLMQAVRSGKVVLCNALGSGLGESLAWLPMLPDLCRRLLGEDLMLESLPTWWCGDEAGLAEASWRRDELQLRPVLGRRAFARGDAKAVRRDALWRQIEADPAGFVAQQWLPPSQAPSWEGGAIAYRPVTLRVFAAACDGDYIVMPGGLARFAADAAGDEAAFTVGGSKDTWVLSEAPVSGFSLLAAQQGPVRLRRDGGELASRVADNLFWLGRYAERCESYVRLFRGLFVKLSDGSGQADPETLAVPLRALEEAGQVPPDLGKAPLGRGEAGLIREIAGAVLDADRPAGLRATLSRFHGLVAVLRDRISLDTWRTLNHLRQIIQDADRLTRSDLTGIQSFLDALLERLSAFSGLEMENMQRGPGWRLLDTGRRLERAHYAIGLAQGALPALADPGGGRESSALEIVLVLADSIMTYRQRYLAAPQRLPVLDLVLTDESNPRSLAFQLDMIEEHVRRLPREAGEAGLSAESRLAVALRSAWLAADLHDLATPDAKGRLKALEALLASTSEQLTQLAERLSMTYLTHAQPARRLVGGEGGLLP